MRKISIALTLTALLMLPALAHARVHNPGNSAGDEYTENVPGAGGDHQGGGSGGGSGSGSLPPGTLQALQEQGGAGAGAANFANSTGPKAAKKAARAQASGQNGTGSTSGSDSGSGAGGGGLGDVVKQVASGGNSSDSDGMGIALPIILAASVLGALAFLLARRRGGSGTPGTA